MEYSNPKIPEGINTSSEHPLKEFFLLSAGVLSLVAVVILILSLLADKLAHHIPYSAEKNISSLKFEQEIKGQPVNQYLSSLTHHIERAIELPDDMKIKLHYVDADTVNAFAFLGGHVVMFRGLMEKLPNENALAMVLAHEIAHIKHRHPIRSLGRGVVIAAALSLVSSSVGSDVMANIMGKTGYVTALKYSRDHETEADDTAIQAMHRLYGHLNGAEDLFHVLEANTKGKPSFEFFSTHPLSEKRIQRIQKAQTNTSPDNITPLPTGYAQ